MWLLPWNANSDFYSQYEIGEHVPSVSDRSIWTFFKAKKKTSGEHVSMFRFDIKDATSSSIDRAKQFLKRIKTLRHPSILKYIDSFENEKSICIVTEGVVPLTEYLNRASDELNTTQRDFSIAYGLVNIAKGLSFMNNDCNLIHNNINIHSIFVTNSGVWKVAGLEYVCAIDEKPAPLHSGLDQKYTPPEILDPTKARNPGGKFALDSWGMGCLVWECFNKQITPTSSVKTVGKMPKPLSVHYNRLVQTSPKYRVSPMDFVKNCKEAGVFFNSPLLDTVLYLEEIQLVKELSEKAKFFERLGSELESFPPDVCKNKILPDLINALEYGEAGSAILDPIFKIGNMLTKEEYQNKLVPCVIKLYSYKDRATRSKLLLQINSYINFLPVNVINDQIFPQTVYGLMDSNVNIRKQTLVGMMKLSPKLTPNNLKEGFLKHITQLIARDDDVALKCLALRGLSELAKVFSSETRETILLQTFLRGTRDPSYIIRIASIEALGELESLLSNKDCANKIMPTLCHLCLDPMVKSRQKAIELMKLIIKKLEDQCKEESASNKYDNHQNAEPSAFETIPSIPSETKSMLDNPSEDAIIVHKR